MMKFHTIDGIRYSEEHIKEALRLMKALQPSMKEYKLGKIWDNKDGKKTSTL